MCMGGSTYGNVYGAKRAQTSADPNLPAESRYFAA